MMTVGYRWTLGLVMAASMHVNAATQLDIDTARNNGLAYLVQSQKGPGFWSTGSGLPTQTTALALEALQNAGISKGGTYLTAISWLSNSVPDSVDGLARKILALQSAGKNNPSNLTRLLAMVNAADRYTWGTYSGYQTSFPDTPLALSALKAASNGVYPNSGTLLVTAVCEVVPSQAADGSWSFVTPSTATPTLTSRGAILPTAYLLMELNSIRIATGWTTLTCAAGTYSLPTLLTNGANWLLTKKNADNGFGDNGTSSPLETALVYLALKVVRPTDAALAPAQDYLLIGAGKPLANGSWANDALQTALVLKTLPATVLADTVGNGIPDTVKTALGIGTSAIAARTILPDNGQSQAGITQATLLSSGIVGQPFSVALSPGFTGPFSLSAGSLPDGLSLNTATGIISGTPSRVGTFNFNLGYAAGTAALQIAIAATTTPVPLLPGWALILFAASLFIRLRRAQR